MSFVVFEQDPLVRDDIIETLASEFADRAVRPAEVLQDLLASNSGAEPDKVFVASLPDGLSQPELDEMLTSVAAFGTVVITNAVDGRYKLPQNSYYVQRPFGSDLLIKAVRTVLSGQLAPRS